MEYSPPPLFKQGPSAIARLFIFVVLALVLLVSDSRFKTLEKVRELIGTGLYPLQRVALVPRDTLFGTLGFFTTAQTLRAENTALQARNLQLALTASQVEQLQAENLHLRGLLQLASRPAVQSIPSEIQYDTRDPFTQKVVIDHGAHSGVQVGAPVVNEAGVLGQVTRVYALQAEVTLITDKDEAIPVQVVRTGLRSVIYGTPRGEALDLRFVPSSADLKVGDQLVTSGLDGVFPAGLPVARVAQIDHQADTAFARVICTPVAPIHGPRQLLVLQYTPLALPPPDFEAGTGRDAGKTVAKKTARPEKGAAAPEAASTAAHASPAAAAKTAPAKAAGTPVQAGATGAHSAASAAKAHP
jgi:rod shape-determining protein MreC